MSKTARYIFIILGVVLLGYILWYFKSIVAYILISMVLSLIGKPVVDMLLKFRIRHFRLPRWFCALTTLILLWVIFYTFFRVFIPVIAKEANDLSGLKVQTLTDALDPIITRIESFIDELRIGSINSISLSETIAEKVSAVFNISTISNLFSSIAGILGNIFIAVFAISFITFFFLKDENMFTNAILLLVPEKHTKAFQHALDSIKHLLMRYFVGILAQITGIITLVTLGLTIVGVGFRHSLVIGLLAGFLNVIPYLGPWLGAIFGTILGMIVNIEKDFYSELLPMAGYMILVFVIVQVIDNVVFQPVIFSSSVNAHPLEIFLVIMVGASLAGIIGMILAIPTYTVLRVFAKEFFNQFRVVKQLTRRMDQKSRND
ncbi:MAG: AI-2E family transporter [Bacteroidales bacterium]|nr:AI-2E family transporter [Bacteroidales bacterium]